MMSHKFQPLSRLFCAWHWSSMSASMSVYLRNCTKWPPITCPIGLRWWWKLVDKTFIPPHYCGTFISSKNESVHPNSAADVGKISPSLLDVWISVCVQAERCQREVSANYTRWCIRGDRRWQIVEIQYITLTVDVLFSFTSFSSLFFSFILHNFVLNVYRWI